MNKDAGATLTAVIGVVLVRLAVEGTFRRYVRSGMGPWLLLAGVLLILLGIVVLWRHRHGDDDHAAHEHGGEQVAWLLLAPVLVLLVIAPGALGSFSLGRTGSAVTVRSGGGVYTALDPTGEPARDVADRVRPARLRRHRRRQLQRRHGPVGRIRGARGRARASWSRATRSRAAPPTRWPRLHDVVGWDGPVPDRDTWVEVMGPFEPGGAERPRLAAVSVTPIPEPDDPYE